MSMIAIRSARLRRESKSNKILRMNESMRHFREEEQTKLDVWFAAQDLDGNGMIDARELASLMPSVEPDWVHSDAIIEKMMAYARELSAKAGTVHAEGAPPGIGKDQIVRVLDFQKQFAKERQFVDFVFSQFDADNSGFLDFVEMRNVVHAVASGTVVMDLDDSDPLARKAQCVKFRLFCLEDLYKSGKLNQAEYARKREMVFAKHPDIAGPKTVQRDIDDADLEWVMLQCDGDNDGRISKDECSAAIALWLKVANLANLGENDPKHATAICAVM
ncbi:hypothetical protein M885DRAFT_528141 [Pelagophyceae sp. CCMP2097]|nr:hypothetical protein M885DRAFT_528141 [Pelagophyceae sp. CCMP2097]|mmetsp:Transcript_9993/g.32979  ORF Transcript_9993/g.32979 Transcript_9993/m.32979 type:complete len:275 (+) Transcript_9993:136-960(+)